MILLFVVLLSIGLTWVVLLLARHHLWLDLPSARSAHSAPTPRGGGISIILLFVVAAGALIYQEQLPALPWILITIAVTMVAIVGLIDDFKSASVLCRLIVQIVAVLLVLVSISQVSVDNGVGLSFALNSVIFVFALFCGVWSINLYNFMDGIDGIAGLQAFFVSVVMAGMFYLDHWYGLASLCAVLTAASLGFLVWNFPKARIFMGDSGSGGLGIIFFSLVLWSSYQNINYLPAWLIVFAVFIVDATFTLIIRSITGQRILSPHNLHCYQKLTKMVGSHFQVSVWVAMFNFLWLAPLAVMTFYQVIPSVAALLLAYFPVLALCIKVRAGFPIERSVSN